jgi:cytochrome c
MKPLVLILSLLLACSRRSSEYEIATGGNASAGETTIENAGCAACHAIPGIAQPGGRVGPPLSGFSHRAYIGGELPNTPDNLVRWIRNPHAIEPKTAMPNLGLTEKEARDVAAYLYSLE